MANTKREQILEAVLAVVKAAGVVPSTKVFRSRVNPFSADKMLPCITLEPTSDKPNANNLARIDWNLSIRITIWVQGDVPDQVADPIIHSVHTAMMADETLGGLLVAMNPTNLTFEFADGNHPQLAAHYEFDLNYHTLLQGDT